MVYGDACSGVPDALHASTFAAVNAVVRRLEPAPDFIVFPGDEVIGLTRDEAALREQWRHWFEVEMGWLDRDRTPLYHTTANHTVYDPMSERVFAEVMGHLPRNGPVDQQGLSYWVRRGDLLLVFVNTLCSRLGGEGHVETEWLAETLAAHADARVKLVVGHHPVFPVNGFEGPYQREVGPPHAEAFWRLLTDHGAFAYLCSHILAFDVQVHGGVLQVTTAGAGTAHRMPEGIEYLHAVQAVIDADGLRYQVLDDTGKRREQLRWPPVLPSVDAWADMRGGAAEGEPVIVGPLDPSVRAWRFSGRLAPDVSAPQTLVEAGGSGSEMAPLWIGIAGPDQRLRVVLGSAPGRSPHTWFGPSLRDHAVAAQGRFDVQVALHGGMGPGGLLWRWSEDAPWSSLRGATASGPERLDTASRWTVGHGGGGRDDRPFDGTDLRVWTAHAGQGEL